MLHRYTQFKQRGNGWTVTHWRTKEYSFSTVAPHRKIKQWQWLWKRCHNQKWGIKSKRLYYWEWKTVLTLLDFAPLWGPAPQISSQDKRWGFAKCWCQKSAADWRFWESRRFIVAAESHVIAQYRRAHWPHARCVFFVFLGGVSAQRTYGIWGSHSLLTKLCRTRLSPGLLPLLIDCDTLLETRLPAAHSHDSTATLWIDHSLSWLDA